MTRGTEWIGSWWWAWEGDRFTERPSKTSSSSTLEKAECFLDLLRSVFSHSKVRPHSLISQVRVLDRTTLPLLHWALFSIQLATCDKVLRPLMMKKLFVLCRQQKSWAIPSDVRHLEYILRQLRISWILPLACQHWQWFEYNTFYYAYPASPFIPCNTNM